MATMTGVFELWFSRVGSYSSNAGLGGGEELAVVTWFGGWVMGLV